MHVRAPPGKCMQCIERAQVSLRRQQPSPSWVQLIYRPTSKQPHRHAFFFPAISLWPDASVPHAHAAILGMKISCQCVCDSCAPPPPPPPSPLPRDPAHLLARHTTESTFHWMTASARIQFAHLKPTMNLLAIRTTAAGSRTSRTHRQADFLSRYIRVARCMRSLWSCSCICRGRMPVNESAVAVPPPPPPPNCVWSSERACTWRSDAILNGALGSGSSHVLSCCGACTNPAPYMRNCKPACGLHDNRLTAYRFTHLFVDHVCSYGPRLYGTQWYRWFTSLLIYDSFVHLATNLFIFGVLSLHLELALRDLADPPAGSHLRSRRQPLLSRLSGTSGTKPGLLYCSSI